MTKKQKKEYQDKLLKVRNLIGRLDGVENHFQDFKADSGDLDLIRYALDQTEGLLEILLEEE